MSKNLLYENPYGIIGALKSQGLNHRPKDICTDSDNGTREAWNTEILLSMKY